MNSKYFNLSVILMLAIFECMIESCVDSVSQKRNNWEKYIDSLNRECPILVDSAFCLTRMKWYHDTIKMDYIVNDNYYPVSVLESTYHKNENDIKITRVLSFVEKMTNASHPMEDLVLLNASIKENISSRRFIRGFDIIIKPEEIKKISETEYTEDDRNYLRLKNKINGESFRCPYEIEEGMTMENVSMNHEYVTFHIKVDERLYPMDLLRAVAPEIRQSILEDMLNGPSLVAYGDLYVISKFKMGFRYQYVGNQTGKSVDIILDHKDLPSLDRIKERIQITKGGLY